MTANEKLLAEIREEMHRAQESWKRREKLRDAAPDLLVSLIETLEIASRNESGEYVARARAAISKATGI